MGKSAKTAFSTLPPEELLVDYARRLGRHRAGRRAVHLKLSRLTRAYRHPQDLRAAEGPFRTLLGQHDGELFRLGCGDLVCCAKAPQAAFDSAVLRVLYMMRDDTRLRAAIERGEEDAFLCAWYDLARDYDGFCAFAEGVAAAAANAGSPSVPPDAEGAPSRSGNLENGPAPEMSAPPPRSARSAQDDRQPRPLDAEDYARLERNLSGADLTRFLLRRPVMTLTREGVPVPAMERLGIDPARLADAVMPGTDLTSEPWFHRRLAGILAIRLLGGEMPEIGGNMQRLLDVTTESLFSRAFDRFVEGLDGAARKRLILGFAAADVFADPERYLRAYRRLTDCGMRAAVTELDPVRFAMREDAALPAAFDGVSWPKLRIGEGGANETMIGRFVRALRQRDGAHVLLDGCDSALAVEFGRDLGIRLYAGPHVEAAAVRGRRASGSTRRAAPAVTRDDE